MRLDVRLRDQRVEHQDLETIERRTRFALGRFGHRISRTEVTLTDCNGPRGGRDKQCTVRVVLRGLPPVVIEVTDIEPMAAVSRAVARASRHVRDRLNRRRDVQRMPGGEGHRYPGGPFLSEVPEARRREGRSRMP